MSCKFALFFVLALVAFQGTQAKSISTQDDRGLAEIWQHVKDLIEKIKQAIGGISGNISEILKKIQEKIKEIIDGLDISGLINKIREKIEQIIGQVGEVARVCIDSQREAIEAVAQESQEASMECVTAAQGKVGPIKEQIDAIIAKAQALKEDVMARAMKCIKDNNLNLGATVQCIKQQIGPITEEIAELKDEAVKLMTVAKEVAVETTQELATCMSSVAEETSSKQQVIVEEIKKCIVNQA